MATDFGLLEVAKALLKIADALYRICEKMEAPK